MHAEERLKSDILNEALEKNVVKPSRRREMAQRAVMDKGINIRLSCWMFSISETCYRYQASISETQ